MAYSQDPGHDGAVAGKADNISIFVGSVLQAEVPSSTNGNLLECYRSPRARRNHSDPSKTGEVVRLGMNVPNNCRPSCISWLCRQWSLRCPVFAVLRRFTYVLVLCEFGLTEAHAARRPATDKLNAHCSLWGLTVMVLFPLVPRMRSGCCECEGGSSVKGPGHNHYFDVPSGQM